MNLEGKNIRSILVIDDDRDDFELIVEAVAEINPGIAVYFIDKFEDGAKYFNYEIDLVLLDINMPHHDGFFWLKAIRERGYKDLPIVMYTNSLSPHHIAKAYEEGANLYFSKPDSFTRLIEGMKQLLQLNWKNPLAVTQHYVNSGKYSTFQLD